MIETNESLLERLRDTPAHLAWREFYDSYASAIIRYARKLGLDAHQAEEVLQETMVALMRILPGFAYDRRRGQFRNFLLTIVHRKSLAALRRRRAHEARPWDEAVHGAVADSGAHQLSPVESIEAVERWRESLYDEALAALRLSATIEPHALAVFEAYVVQGEPATGVAARFGLKENAVYQIKNRLTRRLRVEVARRMRDSGAGDAFPPADKHPREPRS